MTENKIEKLNSKIQKLKDERDRLIKESKFLSNQQYRKDRARRLIQTGALAEKYFDLTNLTIEEREELFKIFSAFINANKPMKFKK